MRIHDQYVLRFFLKVLFLCSLSFVVVFVLADLFEKMDDFIDYQANVSSIARLYLYKVPDIVRLTLPVDLLLATIFTLGILAKNNEIVALLASGVGMLRLAAPILGIALLLVAASTLLSEFVVPRTNARMFEVQRVRIEKRPPLDAPVRHDFSYRGQSGYVYYVRTFNVETQRLLGVVVHQYHAGHLVARLDAESAEWRDDHWEFARGFYRTFTASGEHARPFHTMRLPDLAETPTELARIEPEPEAMTYRQLQAYVDKVRSSGGKVNNYLVQLYAKISDPLTNLVLALLGIGLAATKRKTSLATGFGLTLTVAFAYLATSEFGAALGHNETIPPLLAAWIGPLLFGTAGLLLLVRVNR